MDKLIHGTAAGGTIRVIAAVTTNTVSEAIRRHQTSPTVSSAFGRVLTGALLLGSSQKDFDRLTVRIESDGAVEGIVAETNAQGKVRGYVRNPVAELPQKNDGRFDVSGIVGKGMFHVIRESGFDIGLFKDPYHGSVPIVSGEIAEDFAYYLAKSEQIPAAVLLGVKLQKTEPYVTAAGGVMLQMMPDAKDHIITMLEDTILHTPHLSTVIHEETRPQDLAELALGIIDLKVLEEKDVAFECSCSMERAVSLIASLGKNEVESMLAEDKGAVMTCGFCNETYKLDEAGLSEIIRSLN